MADYELSSFSAQIDKGLKALDADETLMALVIFEHAARIRRAPIALSCLGYCLAREKRQWAKGIALCREAIEKDPHQTRHFLNLGRLQLLTGQKVRAIRTFRRGLQIGRNPQIVAELKSLGRRRPPVITRLDRSNPLNKYLGLLFTHLGIR